MPNNTDAQISKWANDYERMLCASQDLIVDRASLAITANVGLYTLPNYVTNIAAILWLGREVYPKEFMKGVATNDTPLTPTSSIPLEYVYSNLGGNTIRFLPYPATAVAEYGGDVWSPAADEAGVIVQFYRTPHLTDTTLKIPIWIRRYLLKDYICAKAFKIEGRNQDLRGAKYYETRMGQNVDYLKRIKENMYMGMLRAMDVSNDRKGVPGRPVMPDNYPRNRGYR